MAGKERLSVTVDPELVAAGRAAVAAGERPTLSAWVGEALRRQVEHDERLRAMDEFIAAYEAEFGPVTEERIAEAQRWADERTIHVQGGRVVHRGPLVEDVGRDLGTDEPHAA